MKKVDNRIKRKRKIRSKIFGVKNKPRLTVFKSDKYLYVQIIDDEAGKTLCSANTKELLGNDKKSCNKSVEAAKNLGKVIADKAKKLKIEQIVFDRNGYLYHGKLKAFADSARENGIKF